MAPYPKAVAAFPRLRQSILATFDACGLATRFDLEHRQGWSGHRAAGGQILHRAIARCLEVMEENGEQQVPVELAMTIYDEVIRQADVPVDGDALGDSDVPVPLREIADMRVALRSWAMHTTWDVRRFAGIERRYDVALYYPDGEGGFVERIFTTKPDLLTISGDGEHALLYDWKSGWAPPPEKRRDPEDPYGDDEFDAQGYFQQRAHALVIFTMYPRVQRVTTREFWVRYASGKSINPVREATIDRHVLPELQAEFAALIERFDRAYEHAAWRPAPGTHCSFCPRPESCTIFPAARAEGRIGSAEEAERLAGRLQVLDALKRQTTKALRTWSSAHGDVPVRDAKRPRVYGPVVRQEQVKPEQHEVAAALARGEDPSTLYTTKEVVKFVVHEPTEVHPHVAQARREEEELLAMERAAAERKAGAR